MKEGPILFSGSMVRAIIDGSKTNTRRILNPQPHDVPNGAYCNPYDHDYDKFTFWTSDNKMLLRCGGDRKNMAHWRSPYGAPGDQLWVRETWCTSPGYNKWKPSELPVGCPIWYRAQADYNESKWCPSIFMPRWASRITLEITDVRVKLVQDISEDECIKEGIRKVTKDETVFKYCVYNKGDYSSVPWQYMPRTARECFIGLWDSINAKRGFGWASNPWVWVVEFARIG